MPGGRVGAISASRALTPSITARALAPRKPSTSPATADACRQRLVGHRHDHFLLDDTGSGKTEENVGTDQRFTERALVGVDNDFPRLVIGDMRSLAQGAGGDGIESPVQFHQKSLLECEINGIRMRCPGPADAR